MAGWRETRFYASSRQRPGSKGPVRNLTKIENKRTLLCSHILGYAAILADMLGYAAMLADAGAADRGAAGGD